MEVENKDLEVLFNTKVDAFIKYQQYICKEINKLVNDLFTDKVIETIYEYQKVNRKYLTKDDLWIKVDSYELEVKINPDKTKHKVSNLNTHKDGVYVLIKDTPSLISAINDFRDYEYLLNLIKMNAISMIKEVFEWKNEYVKNITNYLKGLEFSIPEEKPKHYVVKIEEVEE